MDALYELLPISISSIIDGDIRELRLCLNKPLYAYDGKMWRYFTLDGERYIVTKRDIENIILKASANSLYSVNDYMTRGYIPYNLGIRIGVLGEGVTNGEKILGIKNVSALVVRVQKEVTGCADKLKEYLIRDNMAQNTLIIAPPMAGKTTYLRDIGRLLSSINLNVVVIDERGEISGSNEGIEAFSLGDSTYSILNIPKVDGIEMAVRSMSPDVIITDELYGEREIDCILDAMRAGVKVCASVHGDNENSLKNTPYQRLLDAFSVIVVLSRENMVGEIKKVIEK